MAKVVQLWLSVDPLADKYPSMSPYMYCAGNPVMLVDPDGQEWNTILKMEEQARNTKLSLENSEYYYKSLESN